MSETTRTSLALEVKGLSKVYRLYSKPMYRALDLLGLCPSGPSYFREHPALNDVDLQVLRGQKVAIIGRNGAGKSTLLKIITNTIRPTAGTVRVNGNISALLQIGTGFHPDFTGRQNVYAGFAHAGVIGKRADELFEEVVDFAEIEHYIDQPMKTYSTGMAARLMFSAATVIVPDILVIDEVLGVGDAYFSHKSFERMRQMCTNDNTTLLLVTHDIYSALNLCERFVWIDRGQVKMDSDGKMTLNAYENSIKEQEEERLRRRNRAALNRDPDVFTGLRVRVSSHSGFALPEPLALSELIVRYRDGTKLTLPVAEGNPVWHLLPEGNLGPVMRTAGRPCRSLQTHGSIFHKAEWAVQVPKSGELEHLSVEYLYWGSDAADVAVTTEAGRHLISGTLEHSPQWKKVEFTGSEELEERRQTGGKYGNARISVESIELLGADGEPCLKVHQGQHAIVRIGLQIRDPSLPRFSSFVVAIHRAGVAEAVRILDDNLKLPDEGAYVSIDVVLAPLILGSGTYFISVSLQEPNYLHKEDNVYFSINPRVYCSVVRALEFVVESTHPADRITYAFHPAHIAVRTIKPPEEVLLGEELGNPLFHCALNRK